MVINSYVLYLATDKNMLPLHKVNLPKTLKQKYTNQLLLLIKHPCKVQRISLVTWLLLLGCTIKIHLILIYFLQKILDSNRIALGLLSRINIKKSKFSDCLFKSKLIRITQRRERVAIFGNLRVRMRNKWNCFYSRRKLRKKKKIYSFFCVSTSFYLFF